MDRLRDAIIADLAEDLSMIDELTDCHTELLDAWNAVPGVVLITDADLDAMFEG